MQSHKISLFSLLALVFLLPIFFLPGSILSLGMAKIVLITLGVLVAVFATLIGILKDGNVSIPSHNLLWGVVLLPLVYFLSAFFGADRMYSFFGYGLEVGTFGYILLASVLFGLTAHTFTSTKSITRVLEAFFVSAGLVIIFAVVKILSNGSFPVWGLFSGNMGNPIGAWTDYALLFAITSILSVLGLAMLTVKPLVRGVLYATFFLSMILLAVVNFSTAWILTLLTSIVVFVYLLTAEKKLVLEAPDSSDNFSPKKTTIWPTTLLAIVALIFVVNPIVSSRGTIGTTVSDIFGVANVDVRPSLTTTLDISKSSLGKNLVFGSGPNTFDRDWLLYKPQEINASAFWNVSFPFGFGFIPTQIASVGLLGILAWLAFFVFFLLLAVKSLAHIPKESWNRFSLISSFLISLFIWIASFMYVPSTVMLALAFFFTGLFVASARAVGVVADREIVFSRRIVTNFAMALLVIALGIGAAALGLSVFQRTVSAYHFQKAITLSNEATPSLDAIENELVGAINLAPLDVYYRALSQLSVVRAQEAVNATTGTQAENSQKFQTAISNSIASSQLATNVGALNYENWVGLGSIFSSLVPKPFAVQGSYEAAVKAFEEAKKLNPTSPEIPLLLARLELDNGNANKAREYINESTALKADYADAYFLLTQLEIGQNNAQDAIRSAETTALLSPNNAGVFLQLGLLKYTTEDWNGARTAFERAITILPDYANAKYYLGLTLNKLKLNEQAIELFKDIRRTNPDNQEIMLILENLENGRDPLRNLPTSTSNIQQREELPLKQS